MPQCFNIEQVFVAVVMGKAEGSAENWHGHVTALTVAPEYRRLGLAAKLMYSLEDISDKYVVQTEVHLIARYKIGIINK